MTPRSWLASFFKLCSASLIAALLFVFVPRDTAVASEHGYEMWFVGEVLAIDLRHSTVRISRGPTETAGPRIIECSLTRHTLRRLHLGMHVDIEADTRTVPSRILHLRPLELHLHSRPHPRAWV